MKLTYSTVRCIQQYENGSEKQNPSRNYYESLNKLMLLCIELIYPLNEIFLLSKIGKKGTFNSNEMWTVKVVNRLWFLSKFFICTMDCTFAKLITMRRFIHYECRLQRNTKVSSSWSFEGNGIYLHSLRFVHRCRSSIALKREIVNDFGNKSQLAIRRTETKRSTYY